MLTSGTTRHTGKHYMREKEKPINRKTFKFLKRPTYIEKKVRLSPEHLERITNLSRREQVQFSKALAMLLNTEEAKELAPSKCVDWQEKLRKAPSRAVNALERGLVRRKSTNQR